MFIQQITFDLFIAVCTKEMGLQNLRIVQDTQITASSHKLAHGPELARLSENEYQGSWIPL